jgi:hypothetical protein
MKTQLVINPMSARSNMARRYLQIEQTLRAENFLFDAVFVERHGYATELTHAARISRGGGHLIIVEPESASTDEGLARFVGGLKQFSFELVSTVKELRGEDGTLLKGMHLTLTGEIGKP